jgi:hypothetical protein
MVAAYRTMEAKSSAAIVRELQHFARHLARSR